MTYTHERHKFVEQRCTQKTLTWSIYVLFKEILFNYNDINSLEIKGMPCVLGFSRETKQEGGKEVDKQRDRQIDRQRYIDRQGLIFILRNWLMRLQGLTSLKPVDQNNRLEIPMDLTLQS